MKSVECGCKLATKPTKSKEHGGRGGSKDKNLGRIASPLHQDHKATLQLGGLELKKNRDYMKLERTEFHHLQQIS